MDVPESRVTILALNSLYFNIATPALLWRARSEQLDWLELQLLEAQIEGRYCVLTMHIFPGVYTLRGQYVRFWH